MNVPHVVKIFLWRACQIALVTKANLFKRKITEDPLCPFCGVAAEIDNGTYLMGVSSCKGYMEHML
jgi:hypothetical protein